MDESSRVEMIVKRLAAGDQGKDIAFDIASQTGEFYPDVETLVERVRAENEDRIIRKQSPLLALIALVTFLAGLGAIGAGIFYIISFIDYYNPGGNDPFQFTSFLIVLLQSAPQGLYLAGGGLVAILGSLKGMQKVWSALLAGQRAKEN